MTAVFWLAIALSGASAACAIYCGRDLVYDGAYYLLGWAADARFTFFVPAREAVQALQQCFEIAGERTGVTNPFALARLLSLGASGWPVLLTAACWFVLPRYEKAWIIGPLLNLVAVIPITSFFGIGEAVIASCLLWLLFLIFMFRMRQTWGAIAAIVLTAICGFTHEAAFLFLAGLSLLAVMGMRRTTGRERAALIAVCLLAAAGSLHLFYWVIFPRDSFERANFLVSLFGEFLGTPAAPNLPALASLATLAAIALMTCRPDRGTVPGWPVVVACAVFVATLVPLFAHSDVVIAPSRYFAARGLPIVFTTVAAFGQYYLRERGVAPDRFMSPPIAVLLILLMLTQTVFQIVMSERWQAFISGMRGVVSSHTGVVSFAESSRLLNPADERFRRELLKSWSVEPLSIVLAPEGRVKAVIAAATDARWTPYRFDDPATLPRAPRLDWSGFSAHPTR